MKVKINVPDSAPISPALAFDCPKCKTRIFELIIVGMSNWSLAVAGDLVVKCKKCATVTVVMGSPSREDEITQSIEMAIRNSIGGSPRTN